MTAAIPPNNAPANNATKGSVFDDQKYDYTFFTSKTAKEIY
ncbi:MAG: hypothetical protein U0T36_04345 [Saprospiraceae bacterium]